MNDPLPKAEGGADISLGGAQGGVRERWKSNAKRHENIQSLMSRRLSLMSRRGQRPNGEAQRAGHHIDGDLWWPITMVRHRGPVTKIDGEAQRAGHQRPNDEAQRAGHQMTNG